MYRCELCRELIEAGIPSHRVTLETRAVTYPHRANAQRAIVKGKREMVDDPGGSGRDIAREATACPRCAGKA